MVCDIYFISASPTPLLGFPVFVLNVRLRLEVSASAITLMQQLTGAFNIWYAI